MGKTGKIIPEWAIEGRERLPLPIGSLMSGDSDGPMSDGVVLPLVAGQDNEVLADGEKAKAIEAIDSSSDDDIFKALSDKGWQFKPDDFGGDKGWWFKPLAQDKERTPFEPIGETKEMRPGAIEAWDIQQRFEDSFEERPPHLPSQVDKEDEIFGYYILTDDQENRRHGPFLFDNEVEEKEAELSQLGQRPERERVPLRRLPNQRVLFDSGQEDDYVYSVNDLERLPDGSFQGKAMRQGSIYEVRRARIDPRWLVQKRLSS